MHEVQGSPTATTTGVTRTRTTMRAWARTDGFWGAEGSAPVLGSPHPHLSRDWAQPGHICAGTRLTPATSAPGLGSRLPHLRRTIGFERHRPSEVERSDVCPRAWRTRGSRDGASPCCGDRAASDRPSHAGSVRATLCRSGRMSADSLRAPDTVQMNAVDGSSH